MQLQEGIAAALTAHDHHVEREVRLDGRSRIDLLVDGRVGVEVKVAGSRGAAARQVGRYLRDERIVGLVLVTSRVRHRLPSSIEGKPVVVVSLAEAGL